MLVEALQTTISASCTAIPVEAVTENPTLPLAVHRIDGTEPNRDKQGVNGYTHKVTVIVVSKTVLQCNNLSNTITTNLLAMSGNTINSTVINDVFMVDESGPQMADDNGEAYANEIQLEINTKNK